MDRSPRGPRDRFLNALSAASVALPFPIVTLAARFGPSPVDLLPSPLFVAWAPWLAAGGFVAVALPSLSLFATDDPGRLLARSVALCVGAAAASVLAGALLHRDYFTCAFQFILAFFGLLFYRLLSVPGRKISRASLRSIGNAGYAVFAVASAWIMLMGYAIATRAEPRPIESVIYNAYNAILAAGILISSRELVSRSFKTLSLGPGGSILLDGAPVDFVLGSAGGRVLRAFLGSAERRANCAAIGGSPREGPRARRPVDCEACAAGQVKASLCPEYRATYNRVLELKKLLEFLEVGTILPPPNKRRILEEGWRLVLFENVRLEAGTMRKPGLDAKPSDEGDSASGLGL